MADRSSSSAAGSRPGGGGGSRNVSCERGRRRSPSQPYQRIRESPPQPPPPQTNDHRHGLSPRPRAVDSSGQPSLPLPHRHHGSGQQLQGQGASSSSPTGAHAASFQCSVCLDMAADPVVTTCGHLYCWACLYRWLHVQSRRRECPVCKGYVTDDGIIPIYGCSAAAAAAPAAVTLQTAPAPVPAPPRPNAPGARVDLVHGADLPRQISVLRFLMDDGMDAAVTRQHRPPEQEHIDRAARINRAIRRGRRHLARAVRITVDGRARINRAIQRSRRQITRAIQIANAMQRGDESGIPRTISGSN